MPTARAPRLSPTMTEQQFDNGYWYAEQLKVFARECGIPQATALRKDQLEKAIKGFLRTGIIQPQAQVPRRTGVRDFELGLRPDLPIVNYTSNKVTKAFLLEEARKIQPGFVRKPGTRYPLNRWREEQIARGRALTYGDLVKQVLMLNETKTGPLRMEHGRYMNFMSDFMAAHPGATHAAVVRAWAQVKKIDAPKTYAAWAKHVKRRSRAGSRSRTGAQAR